MKKILVTGCNGQLGRAIRKEYEQDEVTFINTDVAPGEGVIASAWLKIFCLSQESTVPKRKL